MEFVKFNYPTQRPVFINGVEAGETNTVIMVDKGVHLIDLGSPRDYTPERATVSVQDTFPAGPDELSFSPNEVQIVSNTTKFDKPKIIVFIPTDYPGPH